MLPQLQRQLLAHHVQRLAVQPAAPQAVQAEAHGLPTAAMQVQVQVAMQQAQAAAVALALVPVQGRKDPQPVFLPICCTLCQACSAAAVAVAVVEAVAAVALPPAPQPRQQLPQPAGEPVLQVEVQVEGHHGSRQPHRPLSLRPPRLPLPMHTSQVAWSTLPLQLRARMPQRPQRLRRRLAAGPGGGKHHAPQEATFYEGMLSCLRLSAAA